MNASSTIPVNLALAALLLVLNGCMTNAAIQHATGKSTRGYPAGPGRVVHYEMHSQPHPAYYALLPLTIPADIVASPFELGFYLGHKQGQASYDAQDSK